MKKILQLATLFALALCCGLAGAQLSYTPPAIAAYWFNTPNWNPFTGTGAGQALSYVPPAYGMYYQDTGTKLWYPCNQNGCGGGSGPAFSYPAGTGFVQVTGGAAWGTTLANPLLPVNGGTGAEVTGLRFGNTASADTAATGNQLNAPNYIAGGGTAQAQTATLSPAIAALVAGQTHFCFLPNAANTSAAPTLAVNGLTATAITKVPNNAALVANDLITTAPACVIYDGTQFELQNPQTAAASSGGLTFPYSTFQTDAQGIATGATSFTYTFPQAAQASGATLMLIIGGDAQGSFTPPAGWTCTVNESSGTKFPRLVVCIIASAGQTTASFSSANALNPTVRLYEFNGTRTFDQTSPFFVAAGTNIAFPAITPTAGAAVFSACTGVNAGTQQGMQSVGLPNWPQLDVWAAATDMRDIIGIVYAGTSTGVAITPPPIAAAFAPLSASGLACATWSIK